MPSHHTPLDRTACPQSTFLVFSCTNLSLCYDHTSSCPLVFVSLVTSDVLENSFCLWSLARNVRKSLNRVSPGALNEEENKKKQISNETLSNVVSLS